MLSLSIISKIAIFVALSAIAIIGFDNLFHRQGQRGDQGDRRDRDAGVPEGVDPATLRRRRPMTQRLMGSVLLMAVGVLLVTLLPLF
jgi:hypothetical protein